METGFSFRKTKIQFQKTEASFGGNRGSIYSKQRLCLGQIQALFYFK